MAPPQLNYLEVYSSKIIVMLFTDLSQKNDEVRTPAAFQGSK
jgi:hypothetical protein